MKVKTILKFLIICCSNILIAQDTLNIKWVYPDPLLEGYIIKVDVDYIFVKMIVSSPIELEEFDFQLWVNNQEAEDGESMDMNAYGFQEGQSYDGRFVNYMYTNKVLLKEGANKIELKIRGENKWITSNSMEVIYEIDRPNLHIYSIGIPYQQEEYAIKYSQSDALAFAKAFEKQVGKIYGNIRTRIITTPEATSTYALREFFNDELINDYTIRGNINQGDVVLFYISGHGFLLNNDSTKFRIAGSDFDFMKPRTRSLDFQRDIIEVLEELTFVKPIIFIDACHSGATIGNNTTIKTTMANSLSNAIAALAGNRRTNVLASCGPNQKSYENEEWGNGAFAKAIIEAFGENNMENITLDKNGDEVLDMKELYEYIQVRVPSLVRTLGKRSRPLPVPSISESALISNIPIFSY